MVMASLTDSEPALVNWTMQLSPKMSGTTPRSGGHYGGRRQLLVARIVTIPDLMRRYGDLCHSNKI